MIRNYIKTAFRSLQKNKGFTFINVFGLALGLAICLLIVFYVKDELSYDNYNVKADRIYRINADIKFGGSEAKYAVTPSPLAGTLMSEFPEVEKATRFRQMGGYQVKKGNQTIHEWNMVCADPQVFDVFTLPMLYGNPTTALKDPRSVVITEKMAKKYFNRINVAGETLVFNDSLNFKVTGVIKDIPAQSHFKYDFFVSLSTRPDSRDDSWLSNNFQTYVLLKKGANVAALNAQFPALIKRKVGPQLQSAIHLSYQDFEKAGSYFKLSTIPLRSIHLHSNTQTELGMNGNIEYVYIFSAIAIFILLIACVNFMNLSTARSANRAREVGVRKVLGSARTHLILQFLSESVLVTLISTILAVIGAWALLPVFNQMSGKELAITTETFAWMLPVLLGIVVVVGFIAGSYPAFFLSGFNPINVLKGKLSTGFKSSWLRSFLVVFQFSISVFLIIGTLVIYNQLNYIHKKDIGYNRDHVLVVQGTSWLGKQAKIFKNEVKTLTGVTNVTLTGYTPTEDDRNGSTLSPNSTFDAKSSIYSQVWAVDEDYIKTLGIRMAAGRDFSKQMPTDSDAMIINETMAKHIGVANPLNKLMYMPMDSKGSKFKAFHIVGIVKDFNFSSLRDNVTPVALLFQDEFGALNIRIKTTNIAGLISQVEAKWKSVAPNQPFVYTFMDQDFDATYRAEQRLGTIFVTFTILAIIIACLGLFGLAAYAAEQRTKEIGIRKVLGANLSAIVSLLSKDFIRLVVVSIAIAAPLAWYCMNKWLEGFAYRENIHWWIVASAGAGAIMIAFVTISFQSIKAALLSPVKSLRSE